MKKFLTFFAIALACISASYAENSGSSDMLLRSTLWDANGKPVAMEGLKGKRVVVSFYASWCAGCMQEVKDLNALKLQGKGKYDVIGISLDNDTSDARKFAVKTEMKYFNVVSGDIGKGIMKSLGNENKGIPFTVVIEKNGSVSFQKIGILSKDDLETVAGKS